MTAITYNQAGVTYENGRRYDGVITTHIVTGTDTATGSGTASAFKIVARWARSFITATETATAIPVRVRTASDTTTGTGTATRILIAIRSGTDTATGTETGVGARTVKVTGSDTATGSGTANFTKSFIFRPPVDSSFRWAEYHDDSPAGIWGSKLKKGARASNVYRMKNGTYTTLDPLNPEDVEHIYWGGHNNIVSAQEKADLIAAGYTVT